MTIFQFIALLVNTWAIYFITAIDPKHRRIGYILGFISQLIWLVLFFLISPEVTKLMIGFCICNLIGYMKGIYNFWLRSKTGL